MRKLFYYHVRTITPLPPFLRLLPPISPPPPAFLAVNPLGYTFAFDDVADACGTAYLTIRYWCGTPDAFPFPTSSSAGYFERLSSFNGDSQVGWEGKGWGWGIARACVFV